MSKSTGGTGSTQNSALLPVGVLVGSWNMELYGAEFLPDPRTKVAMSSPSNGSKAGQRW